MMKLSKRMYVVIREGWVPEGYFDNCAEAHKHAAYCNRNYLGGYIVRPCTKDYPRRFDKAILEVKEK